MFAEVYYDRYMTSWSLRSARMLLVFDVMLQMASILKVIKFNYVYACNRIDDKINLKSRYPNIKKT